MRTLLAAAIVAGLSVSPALAFDDEPPATSIYTPRPDETRSNPSVSQFIDSVERERTEREINQLRRERNDLEFENRRLQIERDDEPINFHRLGR